MYLKLAKRVDLNCSHSPSLPKKVKVMNVLINLIAVIISQCICMLSHHVVHLKELALYNLKEKSKKQQLDKFGNARNSLKVYLFPFRKKYFCLY